LRQRRPRTDISAFDEILRDQRISTPVGTMARFNWLFVAFRVFLPRSQCETTYDLASEFIEKICSLDHAKRKTSRL
jgi:hypothetical protein